MSKSPSTPENSSTCVNSIDVLIYDHLLNCAPLSEAKIQELINRFPQHETSIKQFVASRDQLSSVFRANLPSATEAAGGTERNGVLAAGELGIFGEFQLIRMLGSGGMGVVYEAMHPTLSRVALKLCKNIRAGKNEAGLRFRLEAETTALLHHPNIVPFLRRGELDGEYFIAMKLIEGPNLKNYPRQSLRNEAALLAKVARAVHYAHERGILHRDLKPSNILIDAEGEPYVADFGLAKQLDATQCFTVTGASIGTPQYMSPEQASAAKNLTIQSDVFSLGAIAFERVSGQPLYSSDDFLGVLSLAQQGPPTTFQVLRTKCDAKLQTILEKALKFHPDNRYASCADFAADLECWSRDEPISTRPATVFEKTTRWVRRHPWRFTMAAAMLLLCSLTVCLAIFNYQSRVRLEASQYSGLVDRARTEVMDRKSGWKLRAENAIQSARRHSSSTDVRKLDSLAAECALGFDINEPHLTLPLAHILRLKFHPFEPWLFAAAKRIESDDMACPVHMIDTDSEQIIRTFDVVASSAGHAPGIEDILLTADGADLVVGTRADGLHIFDLLDEAALPSLTIELSGSRVTHLAQDGAHSLLAVTRDANSQAELRAIDLTTGNEIGYRHLGCEIASAVFAADINSYLFCTADEILFVNPHSLATERTLPIRFPGRLAYHGGRIVLSGKNAVSVFDAESLHQTYELEPPPSGFAKTRWDGQIGFTPGGEYITMSDNERSQLHVWSAVDGLYQTSYSVRASFQHRLCSDFSASGLMAISGGRDIAIASVSEPVTERLYDSPSYIRGMDIDSSSQRVALLREASGGPQVYRVEIYDKLKLSMSFPVYDIPDYHQPQMCLGPKGTWVAVATERIRFSTEIRVFDTATGGEIARTQPLAAFRSMEATADGQLVIAADSGLILWQSPLLGPPTETSKLEDHVSTLAQFGPKKLLFGDEAGFISQWSVLNRAIGGTPVPLSSSPLTASALSAQDGLLAVGDSYGTIFLMDPTEATKVSATDAHWSGVLAMIWLDCGLLVSSGRDQMLRFWRWRPLLGQLELEIELQMRSNVTQLFSASRTDWSAKIYLFREDTTAVERLNFNVVTGGIKIK